MPQLFKFTADPKCFALTSATAVLGGCIFFAFWCPSPKLFYTQRDVAQPSAYQVWTET
jgi:hypothetical protein